MPKLLTIGQGPKFYSQKNLGGGVNLTLPSRLLELMSYIVTSNMSLLQGISHHYLIVQWLNSFYLPHVQDSIRKSNIKKMKKVEGTGFTTLGG